MPMFNKSKWMNIFGGEFVDVQGDVHVHYHIHTYHGTEISNDDLGVQEELPLKGISTDSLRTITHEPRSDSHHEQQKQIAWIRLSIDSIARSMSGILRCVLALVR
ncbi:hypothetical protein FA15DRAFT_697752 [Coprinopsis marcescibilis]|uniref:Uncharacterized protein n=1 Tax=Coprinopsis marcescibilis TaxID=230819 RepID=A0A5C3KGA5_COPMA|nr:hypothetical protein FA15DRAFT_697752 [Coprinopsis marcescibilis]